VEVWERLASWLKIDSAMYGGELVLQWKRARGQLLVHASLSICIDLHTQERHIEGTEAHASIQAAPIGMQPIDEHQHACGCISRGK